MENQTYLSIIVNIYYLVLQICVRTDSQCSQNLEFKLITFIVFVQPMRQDKIINVIGIEGKVQKRTR